MPPADEPLEKAIDSSIQGEEVYRSRRPDYLNSRS
jgi:hypothetical protein